MESKSPSTLPVKHISNVVDDTVQYLEERAEGKQPFLDTGFSKLNSALLDGIEWDRILTIAALSGGGKSITLEQLKRNIIEKNKEQDFDILSFELEMPAKDQVGRNLSAITGKDTKWLYSVTGKRTKEELEAIKIASEEVKSYPVYMVEVPGTVDDINNTIMDFITTRKLAIRKRGIIITLDHTLLTKGKQGQSEKQIVDELCKMFVELKKQAIEMGVKILIIMLSQLNREIESKERVTNPLLHYPTKNDIFAASSVYYCSDYVLVSHKPAIVNGINQWYGPPRGVDYPKGLPVYNPYDPNQPMVYWHLIKNRFGESIIMMMVDNFKLAKVDEYEPVFAAGSGSGDNSHATMDS